MRITLEMNKERFIFEADSGHYNAGEMKEAFSKLLVCAGYPPDVIRLEDGGRYVCKYLMEGEEDGK